MKKILLASALALSVLSCKENKSENAPIAENAIDNSESSISGSLKSGRKDNMIDKIYFELLKNDKNLKALDDKVSKVSEESGKVLSLYSETLNKSESFYLDAHQQAEMIKDSLLKQQVEKEIKISADQYDLKISNVKELIAKVNENSDHINNLYTAFKIRKTLPEIVKYQNAHPLKADSLENFINKQNHLLNELKNFK
ncbi:hypothetical protein [Chryseobacterium vrystaatense]|uniref:Uncharacterized protein n=1 Tax=Chryseobacterium vrystaatense TaxID=307480 RepID=A0A1M5EUU7_9FLAO|nr:hypothetical protein [Chryseobacterium vrystaatense]SHF82949.1 hypothetical protein SAMN02787073_3040 [Chryseobacterium vrystaatense]